MFIEITTPTNPLRIENTLRPYKKGEKPFSPEVAREILSSTNNPKNIRDTLQLIAALPAAKQAPYKDIVLSAFDHRRQPNDTTILAKKLAILNNYEEELNQIINHNPLTDEKNGIIYASAANEIAAYIRADETPTLCPVPQNATTYCTSNRVYFSNIDFSLIKKLKFKEGSTIYLRSCQNLPKELDVSMCNKVDLFNSNLHPLQKLKFRKDSEVNLSYCANLPEELDVSECNKVNLSDTALHPLQKLKFRKDSEVNLSYCANLPEELDVSECNKVNLFKADISQTQTITFKNNAQQQESKIKIPENWQGKITYTNDIFPRPTNHLKTSHSR